MIEQLILFLALVSAGYILSNQILPLQTLKISLAEFFNKRYISRKKWFKVATEYVSHLFNCPSCLAFWLVLFVMGWQYALIGYVVAGVISRYLDSISFE